ncbi:hypothetical protein [Iodobacter fluviatilis]|uniref:Uncharacterized protein n=1 Tax=Iodobacter fluviatilis TaxID=537 RepID=A0A7G3GC17_9NEIS|nr:hypothetical protein [Iodobacter fluviatilis]QBC45130.1 hypothetical protein C1H71_17375 [Iodobacter fluviatilis]
MQNERKLNKILIVSFILSVLINPIVGFFACAYIRFKQKNLLSGGLLIFAGLMVFCLSLINIYYAILSLKDFFVPNK